MSGGIAGRRALVKVTGSPVVFTDEAVTDIDHQTYQITNTAKRVWDRATTLVVKVGGSPTGESYTFNRLNGKVKFATVNAGRGTVTLSAAYLPLSVAIGAKGYSVSLEATVLDDSDFDGLGTRAGFGSCIVGMKKCSGTVGVRIDTTSTYFSDKLIDGTPLVIEFFPDRSGSPFLTVWASLNKKSIQAAMDAIQESEVAFIGTADDQGVMAA